jgi:adenylate cyclase class 2
MADEIEKKYRLSAERKAEVLESLEEIGAEFVGEDFEENILFSSPDLQAKQAVLRLRRIGARTVLTFKQKIQSDFAAKHHTEYETEVADFDEMEKIFAALGYRPVLVYEKRRRTWNFRAAEIVLDTLPFGEFMEIEGSLTAIAETEMFLGAEDYEVVPETYPNLTLKFGTRRGDLIEARFKNSEENLV